MINDKNKILIQLSGTGNSGKTSTLKEILQLFLNDNQFVSYETNNGHCDNNKNTFPHNPNGDEFPTIITLKTQTGNLIKIGIATAGDYCDIVKSNMDFFKNNDCDIMITPTKSNGATVDYIISEILSHPNWEYIPMAQHWVNNKNHWNYLKQEIANEIYTIVKSRHL